MHTKFAATMPFVITEHEQKLKHIVLARLKELQEMHINLF